MDASYPGDYTRRLSYVFRRFLSQLSTDYDKISQGLFSSYAATAHEIFIKKYYIVQKLDHLTCSKYSITTTLRKPIKSAELKFVFSPELHYMTDGLIF